MEDFSTQDVECFVDAFQISAFLRNGQLRPTEVVEGALQNLAELQDKLNVAVTVDAERALAAAKSKISGPFAGLPVLVKDLVDVVGLPTRYGSRSSAAAAAATLDHAFVTKLRAAGAIVIGKSATSEFGLSPTTEPCAFGPTRNPWDTERSSGGSSGGAAVSVAAGIVPLAHGSDGGGSIRIPASCCGLFGFKPSRSSNGRGSPLDFECQHVLTRSVRDSAMVSALSSGELETFIASGGLPPLRPKRLTIGYLRKGSLGQKPAVGVGTALNDVAMLLKDLGHEVVAIEWPIDEERFANDFLLAWAFRAKRAIQGWHEVGSDVPQPFEALTVELARRAWRASSEDMRAMINRMKEVPARYSDWFESVGIDIVLSPVTACEPPPLGQFASTVTPSHLIERLLEYVAFTPLHNIAGAPAMSVPLAWTTVGLPVGAMFAARQGDDRKLFKLARELEQARPWAQRIPPIHARTPWI